MKTWFFFIRIRQRRAAFQVAGMLLVPAACLPLARAAEERSVPASIEPILPTTPAPARSPIQFFRHLLAMPPQERTQALAVKSPAQQAVILAKINEYEEMPEMVRELRLHLLQLRLYMLPLMRLSTADRQRRLAAIPEKDRPIVVARLRDWDQLAADKQEQILQNESSLHYFLCRRHSDPASEKEALAQIMPQERSRRLEEALQRWRELPETQRLAMTRRMGNFFALSPADRQKVLRALPEEDRLQTEQILQQLTPYSQDQKVRMVDGFRKFAGLSPEERHRFLLHAEQWRTMTAAERNLWRVIMSKPKTAPLPYTPDRVPSPSPSSPP